MNDLSRPVVRAIVYAALGGVLVTWLASITLVIFNVERGRYAALTVASTIVQRNLGSSDAETVRTQLPAINQRLAPWNLEAKFVEQPPTEVQLHQVAIVPAGNGFIRLAPTPESLWRLRFVWAIVLVVGLAVAGGLAYLIGRLWAQDRIRSVTAGDERLRAFLADAAHELRTPLAIAIGYAGILKRGAISDPVLSERIVGDIATEHERLQQLVERILQLARLDAVRSETRGPCDAVRITREAIALVRPLDPDRAIELEAPSSAYAAISEDDLRDALRNLLDNAVRYAPGAPIAVRIENNGEVTIRIGDRGPGMDAFTAEHAFDRFFRGAERGATPGSGLGLSIVRRIVERAGGRVKLDTSPGNGTTIELHLRRPR